MMSAESQLAALEELMGKQEELDPELAAYVDPDGPLGPILRHPLCYNISQHPAWNAMMNETLRQKRAALQRAITGRHWRTVVFLHERPYRIDAFTNYCWRMGDRSYWSLLGSIYTDTENLWQNYDLWVDCLQADRRYRSHLMSPEDRVALRKDHDAVITVHRGWSEGGTGAHGLSWTTNSVVAKYFARRLAAKGDRQFIATGQVKKRDVLGFFDSRSEQEILVLPGNVYGVQTRESKSHSN